MEPEGSLALAAKITGYPELKPPQMSSSKAGASPPPQLKADLVGPAPTAGVSILGSENLVGGSRARTHNASKKKIGPDLSQRQGP